MMILQQKLKIINKLGLHARAAAKLVSCASRFKSDILLKKQEQFANAKSIMGVMMLAASQHTELELCIDGDDAEKALEAIVTLVDNKFGEAE